MINNQKEVNSLENVWHINIPDKVDFGFAGFVKFKVDSKKEEDSIKFNELIGKDCE